MRPTWWAWQPVFEQTNRLQPTAAAHIDTSGVSGAQVIGDPDALGRLVRNLLENAIRYATSRADVTLTEDDGSVTLTIEDDGPGIPVADRTRVLDRFTRLDEARDRDHGGAGLGLAIVKEIIQRHAGSIKVDQGHLGGTRVTMKIPTNRPPDTWGA